MNKSELLTAIAEESGASKAAIERTLTALALVVRKQLANGGEITLPDVGKLSVTERAARAGRNPQTGEAIQIAAHKAVKFTALKALKGAVN